MRTFSELQADLYAAMAQLDEVSRGLAELQSSGGKGDGQTLSRIEALGKRYPVRNHCISEKDGTFQRQYLTLLAALLLVEPGHTEEGWLLLRRIVAGGDADCPLSELQADAATLPPERMGDFVAAVCREKLESPLLLDSMLLSLAVQGGRPTWEYIAGLAELMNYPEDHLQELGKLAASIVAGQDLLACIDCAKCLGSQNVIQLLPQIVLSNTNYHYLCFFPQSDTYWIEGDGTSLLPEETFQKVLQCPAPNIIFRNVHFSGYPILFNKRTRQKKLVLKNCYIHDITNRDKNDIFCVEGIAFEEVQIEGCKFENLSARDYPIRFGSPAVSLERLLIRNTRISNVEGLCSNAYAIYAQAAEVRFENVSMEGIRSPLHWYYSSFDNGHAAGNCTYSSCVGTVIGLPDGFREI